MKKISIYLFVIILISLASIIALPYYQIKKNNDEFKYRLSKFHFNSALKNDLGFFKDKIGKLHYFNILGKTDDNKICMRYGKESPVIPKTTLLEIPLLKDDTSEVDIILNVNIFQFKEANFWNKAIHVLPETDNQKINIENNETYYSLRKPNGIYFYSGIIIILVTLLIPTYLLTLLLTYFNKYIKLKLFVSIDLIKYIAIIFTSFFVAYYFINSDKNFITFKNFIVKNLITFFLIFYLIKFINKKFSSYEFGKLELIKFSFILVGSFTLELLGDLCCNYVSIILDCCKDGCYFYKFGKFSNVLGWLQFWTYFSFINFLSNLTMFTWDLRKKEKMFKLQKSEGTLASSTLASIQSRINPHFLYNALNSIASLARTEPRKTEEMALQLAKFYEQCSDIKSKPLITLAEELEILKSYLKIEKVRFGDRLQVILPTDDAVMETMIPSFTLQPIVENAIKYGYSTDENVIYIRITAETNAKSFTLRIYDSGPPFSNKMHSGYGLNSIAKKLKVLFPERHTISFINEPEKCVEIVLDMKSNEMS
jgi:two-component sensor histidine kinase